MNYFTTQSHSYRGHNHVQKGYNRAPHVTCGELTRTG